MLLFLITLLAPVHAQFTSLATGFTGDTLFFTTYQQQAGTDQPSHGKLFIADDSGVRPLLIRGRQVTSINVFGPGTETNPYDLVGVEVASNGSYLAITGTRECTVTRQYCQYAEFSDIFDSDGCYVRTEPGYASFSPNGEWMLVTALNAGPLLTVYVVHLPSGQRRTIDGFMSDYRYPRQFRVANDGAISQTRPRYSFERALVVDASGKIIIVEEGSAVAPADPGVALWRTQVQGEGLRLSPVDRLEWQPRISDDGRLLTFLSRPLQVDDPQMWAMAPDGGGRRQVTVIPEGVRSAVLSGSGDIAWVVTRTGRLLKVDVRTGVQQQKMGTTAAFYWPLHCLGSPGFEPFAWGALFTLPASVMPGEDVEVWCGDRQATVTNLGFERVTFELPPGGCRPSIRKAGSDPLWTSARTLRLLFDAENTGQTSCSVGTGDPGLR